MQLHFPSTIRAHQLPFPARLLRCTDYSCAVRERVLWHGRLFVSANYVCFYSNIFTHVTKVSPVSKLNERRLPHYKATTRCNCARDVQASEAVHCGGVGALRCRAAS